MKTRIFLILILNSSFLILNSNAQMVWNQACSFAGTNSSYIAIPHSSSLNITGDFMIEAWVNPVNVNSPSLQIIAQKRAGSNNNGYTLYLANGRVAIRTNSTTRLVGKTVIPNNQWSHIRGFYFSSSESFYIYINDQSDTSVTISSASPIANTDSLLIGAGFNSPFKGLLDEIRIYNDA